VIERALELACRRAQAAEVILSRGRCTSADYEDDKLKQSSVAQTSVLAVRVIVDGRIGSAETTDPQDVEGVVARAVELAGFGSEAQFDFPASSAAPEVQTYDPEIERTTTEDLVAIGGEMLELIKAHDAEIKVFTGAQASVDERRLLNSSGLDFSERLSRFIIVAGGVLVRGTDVLYAHSHSDWRQKTVSPREVADRAVEKFRRAERIAQVASRPLPVIFTPHLSLLLVEPIGLAASGRNVLKGDSPLAGRLGEKLCSAEFSLIDDGTVDYAPASGSRDGEGVPRRRTGVIAGGVLRSFLYDLETAGKAGTQSTGNGRGCATSNVIVPAGGVPFADMVAGVREGVIVDNVIGLGQSNIMNGDFSVNVSLGYKIENGEIAGRVKDTMVAGNVYDALDRIEAVGSEPAWYGPYCAPPIMIQSLSVVSKR
jgi:PmbA protein